MEQKLFISRAGADAPFAAEIGSVLEDAGYNVTLQQWDFANRSFMERMHAALASGARVVALLSPEYLRSDHCQAEWQNAIAGDPLNTKSRLVLLRVAECEPVGLLSSLAYWDLVPIRENRPLLEQLVRDAVSQERGREAAIGPYWREPRTIIDPEAIRPVPSFSGREEELAAIAAALTDGGSIAAVHGLGGVGKSSVAREYAWRNRNRYAVIWWMNAQVEDDIIDGLLRLGALFTRGLDRISDRRAAAQQVTRSMLSGFSKPVLLIFDNLDDERLLRTWQPRTGPRVLATSRNAAWSADVRPIALDIWTLGTAIDYLRRESGRADLSEADAREIAEALGALPLALGHAAAALRGMRMLTPASYLQRVGEHLKNAPRHAEYPRSVFATFQTAVASAEQQAPGAAAVLCLAARFAPDAIPDELFRQSLDSYPNTLRPLLPDGPALDLHAALGAARVDEALGALDQLSLLSFAATSRTYGMHRLVQLVARDLGEDARLAWSRCAVVVMDAVFPAVEDEIALAHWPQCERLVSHALAALDVLPDDAELIPAGRLADRCAVYLRERGAYETAEPLQKYALAVYETAYGPDHPEVAARLNHLGMLCWHLGRYVEQESLHARALAIQEKTLGPEHPGVSESLTNLVEAYHFEGRYGEAEPLATRALAICEKALGPDHPDVASSLNSLAGLYHTQGRYREAESLHARALAIREKALGSDHPVVAVSLNNLAQAYREQGRYEEAEALLARALTLYEKTLGRDHPMCGPHLSNLAIVYGRQGRYQEAESLLTRALAIWEKALGPDHPFVAAGLSILAVVYARTGRHGEAAPLFTRALATREKAHGPGHPYVADTLSDFAGLYEAQGRFADAQSSYVRALAIREEALGPDHALTKAVREKLSALRSR